MGNQCSCNRSAEDDNVDLDLGYGSDGVEEDFQHHPVKAEYKNIRHNLFDLMYRRSCYPLYLIKVEKLWLELDSLV